MFESFGVSLGKIKDSNEDAFFCGQKVLGAADGIGSLKTHFGISSKEFSAELMTKCETVIKSVLSLSDKKLNCKDIIKAAYELVESGGSSTFILASLTGRQINILNLGDCGVLLIRFEDSWKIVFQTSPQTHFFNTPYQLSKRFSPSQLKNNKTDAKNFGKSDKISDADNYVITTAPDDILVMGSDGLWDNLSPEEILEIFDKHKDYSVQSLTTIILKHAKQKSLGNQKTPFSSKYNNFDESNKDRYIGGKNDDITVVLAKIKVQYN